MLKKYAIYAAVGAVLTAAVGGYLAWAQGSKTTETAEYNPIINPEDFVSGVNNKYFTLKPGTRFTYRSQTPRGEERIEEFVTHETKKVMGVTTTVVRVREWLNNTLQEDSRDWYAQDKHGNVWYFGETVDNYLNGKLNDHAGSWEAGIDGAKPGIIMLKDPKVGDTYREEYYKGKAEDMGTIVALGKRVTVPYGAFDDCLQTRGWSRIDRTANEYKYYCPAVGFMVLEEAAPTGGQRVELVSVSTN